MRYVILLLLVSMGAATARGQFVALKVSDNHRFLVTADGKPFFWLGDTAWELFHRLNREEADRYLENRAKKGFTVVQAVAIAELDGHSDPNAYGYLPLTGLDPTRPAVKEGPDNDYWDHVDYIVNKANSLGIYVGFLPTWGRYWHDKIKDGKPIFNRENAEVYGKWLGQRYKNKGIIWILGGDRGVDNDEQKEIIRAMARGLKEGDGGSHLMTLHPPGGNGSSTWFHDDDWLDLNMRQNGHVLEWNGRYELTRKDYDRLPVKPVLDGEPIYEDHPVSFNAKSFGHSIAADVRRPLYWDLFSGACGHTYGHHSVWQMWSPEKKPINNPLMPWFEAIDQPGAGQMQHARHLLESRPFLARIPDDSVIVDSSVKTAVPGAGTRRFVATRDESGSFAMVYAPVGRAFKVHMDKITGPRVKAWWFNPRDGKASAIGEFPNTGEREFTPPDKGEQIDWVLVLDDVTKAYPVPGQVTKEARYFELRIYDVTPGKMEAVLNRFRDHIGRIRARHGIETIAYWTATDKEGRQKFIYLIAGNSEDQFKVSEKAFSADPEFQQAYAASAKAHGQTVDKIVSYPMHAEDWSPRIRVKPTTAPRAFELRMYDVLPGKLELLMANYRDVRLGLFSKHGFSNLGFWTCDTKSGSQKFIMLLAHQSPKLIDPSKAAYHADPQWKEQVDEWNKTSGPTTADVTSLIMTPAEFSPLK